jgi:hypothetical protein
MMYAQHGRTWGALCMTPGLSPFVKETRFLRYDPLLGRMRWAGHVARMGRGEVMGRTEGKRPLGRPRRRWEDNIKMDLQEGGWGAWTGSSWLRTGTGGGHL